MIQRARPWLLVVGLGGATALLLAACGDEQTPAPDQEDPWATATYEVVDGKTGAAAEDVPPDLTMPRARGEPEGDPAEILARYFLNPDDGELIQDVIEGAKSWGKKALPAAPLLRDQLLHHGDSSAYLAASILLRIGPEGFTYIHEACASKHGDARIAIALALHKYGAKSLPALDDLQRLMRDKNAEVRGEAALAIGAIGPAAKGAAGRLRGLLVGDELAFVRRAAGDALVKVAPDDLDTVVALYNSALLDESMQLRRESLMAYAKLATNPVEVIEVARQLSEVPELRDIAARLMVESGADVPAMVEVFVDRVQLRGPPKKTLAAAEALVKTGPNGRAAAIPLLIHVLDWAQPAPFKVKAAELLGRTGKPGKANPHVREALEVHSEVDGEATALSKACHAALAALGLATK